jgi:hypothetical protein
VTLTVAATTLVGIAAVVPVSVTVSSDGSLKDVRSISGRRLPAGAIEIVQGWRFTPGTVNGVPTKMEAVVTLAMASGGAPLLSMARLPAYRSDATGLVRMRATVNPDGSVAAVDVIDGPEPLRQASADAVRQWTYERSSEAGTVSIPVEVAFERAYWGMEGGILAVGALIPSSGPFPRPKAGVVPPRLQPSR